MRIPYVFIVLGRLNENGKCPHSSIPVSVMLRDMDVSAEREVRIGAVYEHYKGDHYRIIALGRDSSTLAPIVVYQGLYDSEEFGSQPMWVRPLEEFMEMVEVAGERCPRFIRISDVDIEDSGSRKHTRPDSQRNPA